MRRKPIKMWCMWYSEHIGPDRRTFSPVRHYARLLARDCGYTSVGGIIRVEIRPARKAKAPKAKRRSRAGGSR